MRCVSDCLVNCVTVSHYSFAIEELDDDDSLALSIEGENLAGDHLLGIFLV